MTALCAALRSRLPVSNFETTEFAGFIEKELVRWDSVVKQVGIKGE